MADSDQEKSEHLKGLEAVFEKHTRRFSPFEVLGLESTHRDNLDLDSRPDEDVQEKVDMIHPPPDMRHPPMEGLRPPMDVPHPL
jgi:hypothetical protein